MFFETRCRSDVRWWFKLQTSWVKWVLHQPQALSSTRSVELAVCGVSWVLNWHMCECWTGTSCQQHGSCTSHRPTTSCSWPCSWHDDPPGTCSPLCWSSSFHGFPSTASLNISTDFKKATNAHSDNNGTSKHVAESPMLLFFRRCSKRKVTLFETRYIWQ